MAKDAAGSPPTLEMVARVAGVSRATVSRVVNGSPKVSPDIVEAVNAAVAKLPERYRVPLALAYYADADYDQIAATLKITRTHVGVLLFRAKQLLRQSLAEAATDAGREAKQQAITEANP